MSCLDTSATTLEDDMIFLILGQNCPTIYFLMRIIRIYSF